MKISAWQDPLLIELANGISYKEGCLEFTLAWHEGITPNIEAVSVINDGTILAQACNNIKPSLMWDVCAIPIVNSKFYKEFQDKINILLEKYPDSDQW
jgi:hypothetical protein